MSRFHPASPDYGRALIVFDPATITMAVTAASAIASAAGSIMSGKAEASASRFQAAQMKQQAGQERAVSQRKAIEQRRQAGLANSRVTALAAASGAGATDPTVLDIEGDNAAAGEYNALSALYAGEERARGLEMGAGAKLYEGSQAKRAGLIKGGSTLLSAGSSMFDKYGNGGVNGDTPAADFMGPSNLPWQNTPGYVMPRYR